MATKAPQSQESTSLQGAQNHGEKCFNGLRVAPTESAFLAGPRALEGSSIVGPSYCLL